MFEVSTRKTQSYSIDPMLDSYLEDVAKALTEREGRPISKSAVAELAIGVLRSICPGSAEATTLEGGLQRKTALEALQKQLESREEKRGGRRWRESNPLALGSNIRQLEVPLEVAEKDEHIPRAA